LEIYCPHCEEETHVSANFDEGCADMSGVDSSVARWPCGNCGKEFWFDARLNFEVEPMNSWKKKPKERK
jgi:transposase-like protein